MIIKVFGAVGQLKNIHQIALGANLGEMPPASQHFC